MSQKGASARQQIGQQPLKVNHEAAMQRPGTSGQATGSINQTTQVWVTKWVDYSSKYGLGYLLSDMSAGVFFNDSTKIVAESSGSQFYYYERKAVAANEKQDSSKDSSGEPGIDQSEPSIVITFTNHRPGTVDDTV